MEIIDTHTHVISKNFSRYPLNPIGGHQSEWSAKRPVTCEELLTAMDEAGIAHAVVVQASTVYGSDNSYVAASVTAHRDRFIGVFSVDVLSPDAPAQIKRWVDAGLSGLRLFTTGSTMPGQAGWLDDERSFPAWEYCQAHDISICLQMTADGIPALQRMLARFPRVRVLLDHLARPSLAGGPPYVEAAPLFSLAGNPNVYLKLTSRTVRESARGASTPKDFFPLLLTKFGAHRIVWGSNFPAAEGPLSALLEESQECLSMLSTAELSSIFAQTARTLYAESGLPKGN